MATKEDIPGLVLRIHESGLYPCAGTTFKASGLITLSAEVHDLPVWDKVVAKLDGLAVYSVATLTETLIEASCRRANRAETAAMQITEEARACLEELEAALAFRDHEIAQLKGQLGALTQELQNLRTFEAYVLADGLST